MFVFGLFTKRIVKDKAVPFVAVASPLLCFGLNILTTRAFNYALGYEILMINGLITFMGMWLISTKQKLNLI
jgi:hypothetical protein